MILRQVSRLGGMVEEVLDFARGETRLRIKVTPLADIFSQLRENNVVPLGRAGVKLQIKPTTLELPLDHERALRFTTTRVVPVGCGWKFSHPTMAPTTITDAVMAPGSA